MICPACASASLVRFQAGCAEWHIRHTAILHPDERRRRYMAVFAEGGRDAMEAFVAKVNAARHTFREKTQCK
jgi:hypothetical protein